MSAPGYAAWLDGERRETLLTKVDASADGYSVTSDDGWSFWVSAEHGVAPMVGDAFVTWGSIGRSVRGVAVNGSVLYYRTHDEQRSHELRQADERKAEQVAEYEGKRADFDARVAALPVPLRERVDGFRARGGDAWRWEFESYELMVCEEAARLAAAFPKAAALRKFAKLRDYDAQKAAYPAMDNGHSGNSWGASVSLALMLHEHPESVPQQHGALCPLVGCGDYRCWATTQAAA
jgi:hypothetical protein